MEENNIDENYNKIKDESVNQFEKCIEILNNDNNAKQHFFNFLFNDLIKIDADILSYDIDDIINNSKTIIDDILENTYNKIVNNNKNILKEFNEKLIKQRNIVINKIKECDDHLKILKKIYINEFIESYISINSTNFNFNFDNKKVLVIDNVKSQLILGEFFARFLLTLIISEENSINDIFSLSNNFYDPSLINDYMDLSNNKIEDFKDISINFKYWFILLFLVDNSFNKISHYSTIFNEKELDKLINDILIEDKRKEQLKEDKSKKSKNSKIKSLPNKNITNYKNKYNSLFKNIEYNNEKLEKIYTIPFHNNMEIIFENELDKIHTLTPQKIDLNMKFKNPFNGNDISLKQILPMVSNNSSSALNLYTKIKSKITNIKYDIYESLNLLKNINNKNEINEFMNKLKKKLILLLYFLYDLKKNIYKEYNESILNIFNLNINPEVKNKISKSIAINISNNPVVKNKINNNPIVNNKKKNIFLTNNQIKIKNLKNKMKDLKNKNNIDSDIKILEIEKEIKKIYINLYKLNINRINRSS